MARRPRRRDRQRHRRPRGRVASRHGRRRPALAHRAPQPHRLPVAQVHRHRTCPRQPLRRRRGPGDEAAARLAAGRDVLRARRRPRAVPQRRPARRPRARAPGRSGSPRSATSRDAWDACQRGRGLDGWAAKLPTWSVGDKVATRKASGACLAGIVDVVPGLLGGGADLTGNTGHRHQGRHPDRHRPGWPPALLRHPRARAWARIMNGMALHGGILPLGGTFFVFSDYMRGAVRLAALSGAHVVYVVDPRLGRSRRGRPDPPADRAPGRDAGHARHPDHPAGRRQRDRGRVASGGRRFDGPTALILSRQDLPVVTEPSAAEGLLRGAYVLTEAPASTSTPIPMSC